MGELDHISTSPVKRIFISYAQTDASVCAELERHLSSLQRSGEALLWHAGKLLPGDIGPSVVREQLLTADIILLLITPDFLASDPLYEEHVHLAFSRSKIDGTRVVPILVKPCAWQTGPIATLEALPKNKIPVTLWRNRDDAWTQIVAGITEALPQPIARTFENSPALHSRSLLHLAVDPLEKVPTGFVPCLLPNQDVPGPDLGRAALAVAITCSAHDGTQVAVVDPEELRPPQTSSPQLMGIKPNLRPRKSLLQYALARIAAASLLLLGIIALALHFSPISPIAHPASDHAPECGANRQLYEGVCLSNKMVNFLACLTHSGAKLALVETSAAAKAHGVNDNGLADAQVGADIGHRYAGLPESEVRLVVQFCRDIAEEAGITVKDPAPVSPPPVFRSPEALPMPEGGSWTGVYSSETFGDLHLVQDGPAITGKWIRPHHDRWGEVHGVVNYNLLQFTWKEHTLVSSTGTQLRSGDGYLQYSRPAGDDKVTGVARQTNDGATAPWSAVKQRNVPPDLMSIPGPSFEPPGL